MGYLDFAPRYQSSVLLLGGARSGTTWVGEVIDRHHDHRVVFEPLRPDRVPLARVFANGQYLRRDNIDPTYLEPMTRILTGRFRNPWADHLNHVIVARRRLVKEIRANLLVPWLVERFPGMPVVLLVRHPLGVAVSRRAMGFPDHLDDALTQPDLVADHLTESQTELLGRLTNPLARAVAQASLETLVPLRMSRPDQVLAVTYEELVSEPGASFGRVLRHVGQQPDDALEAALDRPSQLSRAHSAVRTGRDRVADWTSLTENHDLAASDEVLQALGLSGLYTVRQPYPDLDAFAALHAEPYKQPREL